VQLTCGQLTGKTFQRIYKNLILHLHFFYPLYVQSPKFYRPKPLKHNNLNSNP